MSYKGHGIKVLAITLVMTLLLCTSSLAETVENFNATGFPIVNEPITVTAWGIMHPSATAGWDESEFFHRIPASNSFFFVRTCASSSLRPDTTHLFIHAFVILFLLLTFVQRRLR